jgi:UDP-N-acetyl-D-mannosaminuronate dehydrogenase
VIHLLQTKVARVRYHDPYIPRFRHEDWSMESVADDSLMDEVRAADVVVIVTNHKVYDYAAILDSAGLVVDTRNALGAAGKYSPKVVRL